MWQAMFAFRDAGRAISRWTGVGAEQRELEPAHAVDVDPRVLVAARDLIPRGAVYYVDPGKPRPGATYAAYRPLSFYWLFPRRYVNDPRRTRWILAYGRALERLPFSYSAVWHVARDADVAEVSR